jgi:hypothetical protein
MFLSVLNWEKENWPIKGHTRINKIHHIWVECTLNGNMWLRMVWGIDFVKAAMNI